MTVTGTSLERDPVQIDIQSLPMIFMHSVGVLTTSVLHLMGFQDQPSSALESAYDANFAIMLHRWVFFSDFSPFCLLFLCCVFFFCFRFQYDRSLHLWVPNHLVCTTTMIGMCLMVMVLGLLQGCSKFMYPSAMIRECLVLLILLLSNSVFMVKFHSFFRSIVSWSLHPW